MNWLIRLLNGIQSRVDFIYEAVRLLVQLTVNNVSLLQKIYTTEQESLELQQKIYELEQQNQALLKQILGRVDLTLPVKFTVKLIGDINMTAKKVGASLDFQLLDNGTAKAVATPDDAAGLPSQLPAGTLPSWTASDPAITVSPDPSDASGLTAIVAPATPPSLVTGATVSVSATFNDASGNPVTISGTSDPIDVVSGGPAGFKIALQ